MLEADVLRLELLEVAVVELRISIVPWHLLLWRVSLGRAISRVAIKIDPPLSWFVIE
jgi:hypothetical protein